MDLSLVIYILVNRIVKLATKGDKSQGLPIEDIAKNSNTSMKMLDSHYLVSYSNTEKEKLLEQLYGKDKRNPKKQK